MDPVSRSLADIEHHRQRLLPFVVLAAVLHVGLVSAVFLIGRYRPGPRAAQLPTVSVRLIEQPQPVKRPSKPAGSPQPVPTAAPQPTPMPQPTAKPEPPPAEEAPAPSEEAMPDVDSKPQPTRPPTRPDPGSTGGGRRGLSLGGGNGSGADSGIPSDFQFTYYINRMLALIESRWYKPPAAAGTGARARFTILRSGQLQGIALEESSGSPTFDRAVLRALYAANPLPPLPPAYLKPSLTVHLRFSADD